MDNKKGLFIVLEGGEGVGKTTNSAFMQDYLLEKNIQFQTSREPGGTALAEKIRELILDKYDEPVSDMTELLLVFAARAQHLQEKVLPVLATGQWLLCDRFTDATYAYQGGGRQMNKNVIGELEQLVQGDLRPDLTIILDAPIEVGRARAEARAELDRLESEVSEFHQRVRDAYLARAKLLPEKYAVINANQPLENVQSDIRTVLAQRIKAWHVQ